MDTDMRYEIAKSALAAILSNPESGSCGFDQVGDEAVMYADALLRSLSREN